MANPTSGFGLKPVRHYDGSPWNGNTVPCFFSADYAVASYIGDPILISPTAAEDDTTNTLYYPKINVSAGTDGVIVLGCVVSFAPNPNNLTQQYKPASQERIAFCCMDPTVVYHIRGCGGGTPASDWIWRNAIMTAGTSSTVTGLSGFMLDEGTGTAPTNNASNTLLIVGVASMPNNEFGDNVIWEVMLNTRFLAAGTVLGVSDA